MEILADSIFVDNCFEFNVWLSLFIKKETICVSFYLKAD